jgi:hypothetical protein
MFETAEDRRMREHLAAGGRCPDCDRAPCYCDGPHGPLSDVYYDEGSLATVYQGDTRYRVYLMPDRETFRIEIDAVLYDASNQGDRL